MKRPASGNSFTNSPKSHIMDYSKPKVIIDLAEYEHLKSVAEFDTEAHSDVKVYQLVLGNIVEKMPASTKSAFIAGLHAAGIISNFIPAFHPGADAFFALAKIEQNGIVKES